MDEGLRVLVGVSTYPGHSYCRNEFFDRLREIGQDVVVVWNGDKPWGFDDFHTLHYIPPKGQLPVDLMAAKQNMIRAEALKGGYTHLLMLESDNIPPVDVVPQLLRHDRDIVSGLYFIRSSQEIIVAMKDMPKTLLKDKSLTEDSKAFVIRNATIPCVWGFGRGSIGDMEDPKLSAKLWEMEDWINERLKGHSLVPILASGLGCVMISREALLKTRFLTSAEFAEAYPGTNQLTDFAFYKTAFDNGLESFVDIDCIVQHLHVDRPDESTLKKWFNPETLCSS